MQLTNTESRYGSISKLFHWSISLLVLTLLIVGFSMGFISDLETRIQMFSIHKQVGLLVLTLMIFRALWAVNNPPPGLPKEIPSWEQIASRSVHILLYLTLILMPLSGWIMSTAAGKPPSLLNSFNLPFPFITENETIATTARNIHVTLAFTITALISIHVLAALKHHFIDKNVVLKRMLPGKEARYGD